MNDPAYMTQEQMRSEIAHANLILHELPPGRVEILHIDPLVLRIRDFVTDGEAAGLIRAATPMFERSRLVGRRVGAERTSYSAYLGKNPLADSIMSRACRLTSFAYAEPMQIVRYTDGQKFDPHLDAFDVRSPTSHHALRQYGQRAVTMLAYLNSIGPECGGATIFPRLGISAQPIKRSAVLWYNMGPGGGPDPRVFHGGEPVFNTTKYAANLWISESDAEDGPVSLFPSSDGAAMYQNHLVAQLHLARECLARHAAIGGGRSARSPTLQRSW